MMSGGAGRVCGVGVALPDLWRTRGPVGVEHGVDLTPCNAALGVVLLSLSCLLSPEALHLNVMQLSYLLSTHVTKA